ncbi:MAG: hypothetical protein CFH41_00134 [Alphaproteobacteria bacterium MarineAlpha11_Bin1]|nr:MAG: hypothetical protein CFH41_00134 [Alphaproteobacteria bacterium MarineAlpha11_Bin1]|tara:strand:+ start:9570 stop:10160 length:591 start_codon:yes stop_codon:yes gene_type:complete
MGGVNGYMSAFSLVNLGRVLTRGEAKEGQVPTDGPQMCGDIDIRIARDGTWHYLGSPIGRESLVKLFASVLNRDEAGDFWLVTPAELCRIKVDDAPFNAVEMIVSHGKNGQVLNFRSNIGETVTAGPDHPIRIEIEPETGEPSPYIMIRDGLEALIVRSVFYDLVEISEEREVNGKTMLGVRSGGVFFKLGDIDDA